MKKTLKGKITICRSSGFDGDSIHVTITDENSGIQFFDGHMTVEDFGRAVTGLGHVSIEFISRGMDKVGLICETKDLVFKLPGNIVKDRDWAEKNVQKFADSGWIADSYFNSQTSIRKHEDGNYYAHGWQRRYVEAKNEES